MVMDLDPACGRHAIIALGLEFLAIVGAHCAHNHRLAAPT
jgi:hypothetical protein